jgi:ankyrin repeat protein
MRKWLVLLFALLTLAGCAERPAATPTPQGAQRFLKLRGFEFNKQGLFAAAQARDVAAINAFADGRFDLDTKDDTDGRTVLISAAARGQLEVVQALLARGANVNAKDITGRTALFHAIEARYDEVANALIMQPQIDLNARGKNGVTALMSYVWRDRPDVTKSLLDRGADVNLQDNDGDTALHGAAQRGDVEVIRMLVAKGADPNARNKVGGTPLMWAAVYGNDYAAAALLKAGADPRLKDEDGMTALEWAIKNHRPTVIDVLR